MISSATSFADPDTKRTPRSVTWWLTELADAPDGVGVWHSHPGCVGGTLSQEDVATAVGVMRALEMNAYLSAVVSIGDASQWARGRYGLSGDAFPDRHGRADQLRADRDQVDVTHHTWRDPVSGELHRGIVNTGVDERVGQRLVYTANQDWLAAFLRAGYGLASSTAIQTRPS
jgi:hypothetical protein